MFVWMHLVKLVLRCFQQSFNHDYCNVPKFSDRYAWANSADPDHTAPEQSDLGLHCLPFRLHCLDS